MQVPPLVLMTWQVGQEVRLEQRMSFCPCRQCVLRHCTSAVQSPPFDFFARQVLVATSQ